MKNIIASVVVAAGAIALAMPASAQSSEVRTVGPHTICAEKARFGWKLSGDAGSVFRNWATNKAIGEAIGDGNCQTGWTMVSSVNQRVFEQLGMGNVSSRGFSVDTVFDTSVEKVDAGKLRLRNWTDHPIASTNPAPIIINKDTGAKKKFVGFDYDTSKAIYEIVRQGNVNGAPAVGIEQKWGWNKWFSKQEMLDCGAGDRNCHKARYWASRDITTTEGQTTQYVAVRTERFHCPAQWSYAHVAPTGEMFVYTQDAKPCQRKVSWSQREVGTSNWSNTSAGDKYIDEDRLWQNQN